MKIMFITDGKFAVPNVDGSAIETLIQNFIDQNEIEKKVQVTVACKYNQKAYEESKKYKLTDFLYYDEINDNKLVKLFCILKYRFFGLFGISVPKYVYSKQIYKHALKENYDFFIVEEGDCFSFDYFTKKFGKEKMVSHTHSPWPMNQKFVNIYEGVIVPSNLTKNALIANKWLEYQEKISVVKNCINENKLCNYNDNLQKELINKYNLKDKMVVLFVGRIVECKGVVELINAVNKVDNVKLLIVGSALFGKKTKTAYEQKVLELIQNNDKVISCGFVPYEEISNYYAIADVVATPSDPTEACNMVNLEAIMNNKPVITTNCGGIPEYVKKDYNGLVIEYDNLVDNLVQALEKIKNPDLRKQFESNNAADHERLSCKTYYYGILDHLERQKEKWKKN